MLAHIQIQESYRLRRGETRNADVLSLLQLGSSEISTKVGLKDEVNSKPGVEACPATPKSIERNTSDVSGQLTTSKEEKVGKKRERDHASEGGKDAAPKKKQCGPPHYHSIEKVRADRKEREVQKIKHRKAMGSTVQSLEMKRSERLRANAKKRLAAAKIAAYKGE